LDIDTFYFFREREREREGKREREMEGLHHAIAIASRTGVRPPAAKICLALDSAFESKKWLAAGLFYSLLPMRQPL